MYQHATATAQELHHETGVTKGPCDRVRENNVTEPQGQRAEAVHTDDISGGTH